MIEIYSLHHLFIHSFKKHFLRHAMCQARWVRWWEYDEETKLLPPKNTYSREMCQQTASTVQGYYSRGSYWVKRLVNKRQFYNVRRGLMHEWTQRIAFWQGNEVGVDTRSWNVLKGSLEGAWQVWLEFCFSHRLAEGDPGDILEQPHL